MSILGQACLEVVTRVVALERLAVPDATNAVPYVLYTQDSFPYWTNSPVDLSMREGDSRDAQQFTLSILMRLVIDHITAGYQGQRQTKAWEYLGDIAFYFAQHPKLDLTGQAGVRYLDPSGATIRPRRGLQVATINTTQQLCLELDLLVPLNVSTRL